MAWLKSATLIILAVSAVEAAGSFEDFEGEKPTISREVLDRYFTTNQVKAGEDDQKCSERVFEFRKRVADGDGPTLGVKPTVGLGAALLIFLLVGTFAAGIAQAFQMVRSTYFRNFVIVI